MTVVVVIAVVSSVVEAAVVAAVAAVEVFDKREDCWVSVVLACIDCCCCIHPSLEVLSHVVAVAIFVEFVVKFVAIFVVADVA